MRLLSKTTLLFLLLMLPVFAGGAFYLFHKFQKEIKHETDEELVNDRLQWIRYLDTASINTPILHINTQEFSLKPTNDPLQKKPKLSSVSLYQETEDVMAPFRELSQVISFHDANYRLILRKSMIEKDDLIKNIVYVMLLAFGGLLLFALICNWFISRSVWKPFYYSLDKIRHLQLNKMDSLTFPATETLEFRQLNTALESMSQRIHQDYINMKELTEDAAHEMQTPLAIAQGKLELLLQDEALTENQIKLLAQSSDELQRLSRLNHNLLLLAKIENRQYPVTGESDLHEVMEKYLSLFEELTGEKELTIESNLAPHSYLPLHPALADILVSNLLGNAIKYNHPKGHIRITLTTSSLTIANTSPYPEIPSGSLFQRFRKHTSGHSGSNGLGLAIVKKIADTHRFSITYAYKNDEHIFHCLFQ
ncbi:MAG TPA: HAMP domain-containing sensor histidine kinase [Chitinophaga sp.]|uniref:sensor histidine kinase n=1 Tax=Chitinophaga sp. TaxID=1869181 RepID=UPI002C57FEC0|nr:HAMP domain-containing sensor histidine kinase [Chitinophaga sp.]HVI47749.1 HAMP domain-containing sensor histidine kinase [Chitinophaga sp.]